MQKDAEVTLTESGIKFTEPDKSGFMAAMEPVYEEFEASYGSEMIDAIKALNG